jgi:hypothetical protein
MARPRKTAGNKPATVAKRTYAKRTYGSSSGIVGTPTQINNLHMASAAFTKALKPLTTSSTKKSA